MGCNVKLLFWRQIWPASLFMSLYLAANVLPFLSNLQMCKSKQSSQRGLLSKRIVLMCWRGVYFFVILSVKILKLYKGKQKENEFLVSSEVISQPLSLVVLAQVRFVYLLFYSCYAGCHGWINTDCTPVVKNAEIMRCENPPLLSIYTHTYSSDVITVQYVTAHVFSGSP